MNKENVIFVVDDDKSARNGISRYLRAAGHEVKLFASAMELLNVINIDVSGCLILDLRMHDMNGDKLAAELKSRKININIIVVSGNDDIETRQVAKDIGAVGFFRKPVDGSALLDAINWSFNPTKEY